MNILALDTITSTISVTAEGPKGIVTTELYSTNQHAENLLSIINTTTKHAGFELKDTSLIIIPKGPGSFTGLRLSWATARGIELASLCNIAPINPLEAYIQKNKTFQGTIISVLDAKKNQFYVQLFKDSSPITPILDCDEVKIIELLKAKEKVLILGPDAQFFSNKFHPLSPDAQVSVIQFTTGSSKLFLEFAKTHINEYNKNINDYEGPIYVRQSDAEESFARSK